MRFRSTGIKVTWDSCSQFSFAKYKNLFVQKRCTVLPVSTYGFNDHVQSILVNRSGSRNLETLTLQLIHIRNLSDTLLNGR